MGSVSLHTHLPSTIISQSEASCEVMWSSSRPISSHRKCLGRRVALTGRKWALSLRPETRGAMNGAICLLLPAAHLSRQLRLNISSMRESRACHNIGNISSSLPSLSWSPGHIYTLIIIWTLVHTALNRILHSWEIISNRSNLWTHHCKS